MKNYWRVRNASNINIRLCRHDAFDILIKKIRADKHTRCWCGHSDISYKNGIHSIHFGDQYLTLSEWFKREELHDKDLCDFLLLCEEVVAA